MRGASLAGLGWLALALGAIVYPLVLPGAFYVDVGTTLLLAAATAAAWNIIGGYAGQVSVGHAMFFGAGAYLPLLVYKLWEWPPIAGLPFGIVVSLVLAVLVGMPTFRLQGHYFSMATIAVAELIRLLVATAEPLGAAIGLQGPRRRARHMGSDLQERASILLFVPGAARDRSRNIVVAAT